MTDNAVDSTLVDGVEQANKAVKENELRYKNVKNISEYVKVSRKKLHLMLFQLEKRRKALNALANYSDEQKMNLLFDIIDKDRNGHIHATELMTLFRRNDAGVTFKQSLEKAITYIALYDADGDDTVDREEFKNLIARITAEAESSFHEMCEYMIMNILFSQNRNTNKEDTIATMVSGVIDDRVSMRRDYIDALSDGRMRNLFDMFDQDDNQEISFSELADGLYNIKDEKFWRRKDNRKKPVAEILLMADKDENRTLDYNEFVQVMLNMLHAAQAKFDEVAAMLAEAMSNHAGMDSQEREQAEAHYNQQQDMINELKEKRNIKDALNYAKLHKLYDLWDTSDDGFLSYEELTLGLRKYMKTMNLVAMTEETLFTFLKYDKNKDQMLNKNEFANLIVKFAKKTKTQLHKLIDFLAVLSVLQENDKKEEEYIKSVSEQANAQIRAVENYDANKSTSATASKDKPTSTANRRPAGTYDNFIDSDNSGMDVLWI
mmetsp:Transcript_1310/g.1698  ORF Transcript_1310/g.1698 Transcript_1310/m.1698 type:complete len:490 (+) Transcript_1310:283-1752(+)|eukprot:CAMPEP_0178903956 /NCGR_PEP_ID=MMETSP0786-20121207/5436_1 /TAXON_ID=186022 /ORGANISM="Thalassionema frauenfeldii, Strain CCMP 1798" /LENGTH=489 /DNA_ID=CAMNT_0020575367 /DNA_START=200 /DNA_END=1669 /DNA_ORIENTATION=-